MAQPSNGQTGNLQTGTANPTPHKSETRRKFVWCLIIISFICSLGVGGSVVFLEKQNIFPNTDGHGRMEYLVIAWTFVFDLFLAWTIFSHSSHHVKEVGGIVAFYNMIALYPLWFAPAIDYGIAVHQLSSSEKIQYAPPQLDPWNPTTKYIDLPKSTLKVCAICGLSASIFYLLVNPKYKPFEKPGSLTIPVLYVITGSPLQFYG